ncbi:MAG: gluconate 2-dehydrogenase subunit 3 family protein [Adhaeribacter sp.]
MKRRTALKNLSMAVAGLVALPAWASGWNPATLGQVAVLPPTEEALLAELVETIIPETDTPGAKTLKVHQFVLRMVQDCYGEAAQNNLNQGLITLDQVAKGAFEKLFINLDVTQRTAVLTHLQKSDDPATKGFISLVKNLTIQGYLNSEYVLLNMMDYKMAPGFYHGCVPLKA